ncbi:exonuclease domain-containing protein [Urechidicola vernalis]|uniref:Exonuclease domain-containing protein n=1 Tax=Urechidicola vernalis TaxID=3075600 RepID=A0ABU2Y1H7_9FLAO|nr:exonuclease domain-containing protein [Urechidicola sp. P050]MDT0552063.1 exonuclease domain-containing protein [Urechidicola sp. P050]
MFAVVDIETTGGKYNEEGITEIAIYKYDGHEVIDNLVTLVNPEKDIQPFVVKLTGISNKMLVNAPKFYEMAKRIVEITEGCVIVAHNAHFDYRILKTEFRRLGFEFERETLCTVELSKKLIPEQESYSLGKLCKALAIPVSNRHRAEGDALATVKLLKLLIDKDTDKEILKSHIKQGIEKELPSKLQSILDNLPSENGVYYIHDKMGEVIFMSNTKDIKKSVNKLFLKTSKRSKTIRKLMAKVSFEKTGNELVGRLKFREELSVNKPQFNFNHKNGLSKTIFSNPNLIIVDKGRTAEEKSAILIENDKLIGYCFIDLEYQLNNIDVLKTHLTLLSNNEENRTIIKKHLQKNSVLKLIRF